MKNIILLKGVLPTLILLITGISINAQEYLTETSKWYVLSGDVFSNYYQASKLEIVGDTIIKENTYKKIQVTSSYLKLDPFTDSDTIEYNPEVITLEFIREDSKKFYRWFYEEERLIMDFDLKVGDEVFGRFDYEIIESIDSITVGGSYRKIFYTEGGGKIFEGIGTEYGLFEGLAILGDEYFSVLRCYFHDGESYKINGRSVPEALDAKECNEVFLINLIEFEEEVDIKIYPTIVKESIIVDLTSKDNYKVFLVNSIGQEIKRFQFDQIVKDRINVEDLEIGIYFLQVDNGEKIYTKKILKR